MIPAGDPWGGPAVSSPDTQISICDLHSAYKEQERLFLEWESMSKDIGKAKAIREIDSDFRKKILSKIKYPFLKEGKPDSTAETMARSMDTYDKALSEHYGNLSFAEETLDRRDWIKARLEALRTVISTERDLYVNK